MCGNTYVNENFNKTNISNRYEKLQFLSIIFPVFMPTKLPITGDFNLVQDPLIDYYNYKHVNNPAARREVLNMIQEISLVDPWRIANEQVKKIYLDI